MAIWSPLNDFPFGFDVPSWIKRVVLLERDRQVYVVPHINTWFGYMHVNTHFFTSATNLNENSQKKLSRKTNTMQTKIYLVLEQIIQIQSLLNENWGRTL